MNQNTKRKPIPPLSLRLSPSERERLEKAANGQPLSAYIRSKIFDNKTDPRCGAKRYPKGNDKILAQVLAMLGQSRIANNLDQLAHHANSGSLELDEETQKQIDEAYAQVMLMRGMLIDALGLIETRRK